ncbi:MAG: family N-acetyltransferase [Devosia sp.]|nr:family N-acetyltransferase [Devosia sp.]
MNIKSALAEKSVLGAAITSRTPAISKAFEARLSISLSNDIGEVEAAWRTLQSAGVESPGQSFDFIRLWIAAKKIQPKNRMFVVGRLDGEPIALLPLHRKNVRGIRLYTWFPGAHAGCYAPLIDIARFAALDSAQRCDLWTAMISRLGGADMLYVRSIPEIVDGRGDLFAEFGASLPVETLYRAEFASWDECNAVQRTKSRRKHDRQQGEKLEAMGQVSFAEVRNGCDAVTVLDTMFRQRAIRFLAMGVDDPFVAPGVRDFYNSTVTENSGVAVRLHVLRLDGEIVAVRYNIVEGRRMFCLISSMSVDPDIQQGSPGKQCLLKVMETLFDGELKSFDMGAGYTDEKRHWCNVQVPLRQHYIPLNTKGRIASSTHRAYQRTRAKLKANKSIKTALMNARSVWLRVWGVNT